MPAKYNIPTEPAPPRFRPPGKLGIVDWREDCSGCHNCVKRNCIYGLYRNEADMLHDERGFLDYVYHCKGCLTCVQNCTKGILTRVLNPEFRRLGDDYYRPEIILTTWFQAETGRIPVTGSGYGGPFSGEGFDSMWTDMSEIVRPTRDGIHGREYINTSVDIGRKLRHLSFQENLLGAPPPRLIEIPMPVIFEVVPSRFKRGPILDSVMRAAAEIGLFSIVRPGEVGNIAAERWENLVPLLENADVDGTDAAVPMVMIPDGVDPPAVRDALKKENENRIVAVRLPVGPGTARRVLQLTRAGAEVIHLVFDKHGREAVCPHARHMRDVLREVHGELTREGVRDEVTLIASGGIALPEHMAKAIICGADLVAIDLPLMVALECRLCGECERGNSCPVDLAGVDPDYAVRRITNLMGAWRNQLIELLGAMGIREVRRLRGETGRSMFFEDLERESFGRLFGRRKEKEDPSPNLSPTRGEASTPPSLAGKGAGGLGQLTNGTSG